MARPSNVLIVDDEPHVRTFLRLMMRELGITECWETGDGLSALDMMQKLKPQLVLLDVNLPELGGMEVLTKLQEEGSKIPVVVVTSRSSVSVVSEVMRLGAVGFLLKHAAKEETLETMRDVLDTIEGEKPA